MGTTNILDLNNRVSELAESYPADNVMMSDGVTSVEDALDGLTEDTGWVTVVSDRLWYRKVGKLVEVQINTNGLSISNTAWTSIGTLPVGARPHAQRRFTPQVFSTNSFVADISYNGEVKYESTTTYNFICGTMYFID